MIFPEFSNYFSVFIIHSFYVSYSGGGGGVTLKARTHIPTRLSGCLRPDSRGLNSWRESRGVCHIHRPSGQDYMGYFNETLGRVGIDNEGLYLNR